jgi:LmbE family N-acetylglucosaminyl deacetylase
MRIQNVLCYMVIVLFPASLLATSILKGVSGPKAVSCETESQAPASRQLPEGPPNRLPDDRFKADILVVVAHPDDETVIAGYLAKAIYDEHRRVGAIFTTLSEGGGNAVGWEQAAVLGAEREIEARRALASFGVMNVWFLRGRDNAAQDVLYSLESFDHGAMLGKMVRLVRLTRPEVILTWLPDYVAGENHGDHQASGVIATEAFDLAGDPSKFPEQISAPRDREGINNLTEGLRPWQPKKIYYFSDAYYFEPAHTDFLKGKGPQYAMTVVSPSRKVPYSRLAAEEMSFHLTQGDSGQLAKEALAKGDLKFFEPAIHFAFGKSLVGGSSTGDIFEGVRPGPVPFAPVSGYQPESHQGLSVELGGPWAFYRIFWKAHNIEHLAELLPEPEVSVNSGETLHVPLLIHNDTDAQAQVALFATLPQGWIAKSGEARYTVAAHDTYPVQTLAVAPTATGEVPREVTWEAEINGKIIGAIKLKVYISMEGMPQ